MARLSVNVNKVATLRNARGGEVPSVLAAVRAVLAAGCRGITVHPRADERHIQRRDVIEIAEALAPLRATVEYNIEGDPRPDLMDLVCELRPHQCTLVPVLPGEVTSQAGWPASTSQAEEYGYETERAHKAEADALAQTRKTQQAEHDGLKEQHERSWAEREKELARREQEYAELKARTAAFPKELEAAIVKAEAEGTGIAKRQAKIAADLQQKENEGKRRVYELRVQQLDETVTKQNEQIAELSRQLATALKQAQDLAIKAIDGASSSNSYAAVKEIALEQAKTSAKTK